MNRITISFLLIILCLTTVMTVNHYAIASRVQGKSFSLVQNGFPVHVARTTGDVYALWQEKKVHGRIVVHLGKFLHFMGAQITTGKSEPYPQITNVAQDHQYYRVEQASYRNFLWNAFQSNIARKIYNVLPPAVFMQRFELKDIREAEKEIIEHFDASVVYDGAQRTFTAKLPSIAEPVLLNIDASYFSSVDAAQLLDSLLKSGIRADLVTVCLAEDNPDVNDNERQQLRSFIQLLSRHAEILYASPPSASSRVSK
jgi:hypothetical protein